MREVLGSNSGWAIETISKILNSLFISKEIGDGCISLSPHEEELYESTFRCLLLRVGAIGINVL